MTSENRSIPVASGSNPAPAGPENPARSEADAPHEPHARRAYHNPLIDIHEVDDGLVLEADLPGSTEDQVGIQLVDNVLSLHARMSPPVPEGVRLLHEEYRVADYYRSFILSDEVDRARITAEFKNGVLRLNLPKAERARTRRIEIKS